MKSCDLTAVTGCNTIVTLHSHDLGNCQHVAKHTQQVSMMYKNLSFPNGGIKCINALSKLEKLINQWQDETIHLLWGFWIRNCSYTYDIVKMNVDFRREVVVEEDYCYCPSGKF